jgi:hypothetical protein
MDEAFLGHHSNAGGFWLGEAGNVTQVTFNGITVAQPRLLLMARTVVSSPTPTGAAHRIDLDE